MVDRPRPNTAHLEWREILFEPCEALRDERARVH